jgi:hypothetical protein
MKNGNARAIAGLVVTGLLVTGAGVFVLPDALDSRLECARADEWVRTHAQELPSTLDERRLRVLGRMCVRRTMLRGRLRGLHLAGC